MSHSNAFRRHSARYAVTLAAVLSLGLVVPSPVRADNLGDELMRETGRIFDYIAKKKKEQKKPAKAIMTVGVLKFRARRGDGPLKFRPSPLTSILAERLETVLLLGTDEDDPKLTINLIRDASSAAARQKKKLTYLTPGGRAKLLALEYPLVAGSKNRMPDLLLTGTVTLDPKTNATTIVLLAFDKNSKALESTGITIKVNTDRALLGDAGRSFALKRSSLVEKRPGKSADKDASDDAEQPTKTPQRPKRRLVELKMLLNKEAIAFKPDDGNPGSGRFTCREPKEGDKVRFVLKNLSEGRVAVVLKVNGMNTLFKQKYEAVNCNKWVLDKGEEIIIDGFYIDTRGKNNKEEFTVVPNDDDSENLRDETEGTVQMHVFVEGAEAKKPELKIARGLSPRDWSAARSKLKTIEDARRLLQATAKDLRSKGLIRPGQVGAGGKLTTVEFKNPEEQQHLFLRYYAK